MADITRTTGASALVFQSTTFNVIDHHGRPWLRGHQIGVSLGYQRDDIIHKLYRKHSAEFTPAMTAVVKLPTAGGEQEVRIFSLRGAHLLAMFARTPKAAEFRRWVLDILDRETGEATPALPEPRSTDLMREARRRMLDFYTACQTAARAGGREAPKITEAGLAEMAETLVHDALAQARWLVHFDYDGQMRLQPVPAGAAVIDPRDPAQMASLVREAVPLDGVAEVVKAATARMLMAHQASIVRASQSRR